MNRFNNIDELKQWVEYVRSLESTKDNLDIFNKFMRFSPQKASAYLNVDCQSLVKEFETYKKEIHHKIIVYNRVQSLIKLPTKPFKFNYNKIIYSTKLCRCIKFFKTNKYLKTRKFYPSIKYLYCFGYDSNTEEDILAVFPLNNEYQKVLLSVDEFNEYFIDMREEKINQIIS